MNTRCAMAAWAVLALAMNVNAAETRSEPVIVNTLPTHNRCWATVFTNEVQLTWNWNANATSAQLNIAGMNGIITTNFTSATTTWLWQAFASDVPAAEDVYDLTLTFYASGGAVVGALTSQLAVVTGAFRAAAVDPVPTSGTWDKVSRNVVIPYDAAWTNVSSGAASASLMITNDGRSQTNALADADGYFGWKVKRNGWGYGTFALSLTFPGTAGEWSAELMRPLDGTAVRVR